MRLLNVSEAEKIGIVRGNPYIKDLNEQILTGITTGVRLVSFEREGRDDCEEPHTFRMAVKPRESP